MYKDGGYVILTSRFCILIINSCFEVTFPTTPHTEATEKGEIKYSKVVRENVL